MTLPNAEDILREAIGPLMYDFDGYVSKAQLTKAMKEYARQVLDYAAQNAQLEIRVTGSSEHIYVDKQSILNIKDELL